MNWKRHRYRVGIAVTALVVVSAAIAVELRRRFVVVFRTESSMCVVCRADRYREVRWGAEKRCDVTPSTFSLWVEENYDAHTHSWVHVSDTTRFLLRSYGICSDAHYIPITFIPEEAHRRLLQSGNRDQIKMFHQAIRKWDTFPQAAALAGLEWRTLGVPQGVERQLEEAEEKQHANANQPAQDTAPKVAETSR
jgi:hypothetical protein